MIVGLLHPGAMGSAVGRQANGTILWAAENRSAATRDRAEAAGLNDVKTTAELVARSGVILSVCPPHAALDVARSVSELGFGGLYVDANAVSPQTVRTIGSHFERFVDGSIIGPPPTVTGITRLYVCGPEASTVSELFHGSLVDVRVVTGRIGAATALKVCYAAWTKGSSALLLAIRALADIEGVEDDLLDEWRISMPDLPSMSATAAAGAGSKGWRFVGEMEEIAATFVGSGLPGGFHNAAAEIYRRLAPLKDLPSVEVDEVVTLLRSPHPPEATRLEIG